MKLTVLGSDFITITELNLDELSKRAGEKVHLIKFDFTQPTKEKILLIVDTFVKTNRFVISNNIKIYNDVLKTTGKKYYIENEVGANIISYLRKNNKILFNFCNLRKIEQEFMLDEKLLIDLLRNVEVVQMPRSCYIDKYHDIFNNWDGNLVLV